MFEPKWRFYFNVGIFILIIIMLGFVMIKIVSAQDDIWIPPTQNGVCNGTQTCFCSGKAVDCPCDADPCKVCGPTSPECAQAHPGQTNPEQTKPVQPAVPECTGPQTCFCSGKAVTCPCNPDPCVICGPTSPECIGQFTVVQRAVPQKPSNNTTEKSSCLQLLSNGFLLNTFDHIWWSQILNCFAVNDFGLTWSAFINNIYYFWFEFINSQFINSIFHSSCWGIRCCTTPVINGSYHKCSDCNKAFEPTAITGPYPYKGVCNVGNVNRYDASMCQIIDCKK